MKMRVGTRLFNEREDRKLTQAEMADLLNVSASTYARIERNETSVDIEQIAHFAKKLDVPIQDFLPDTISVNNSSHQNNQNAQGLVLGNIYNYNYSDKDESHKDLAHEIEKLKIQLEERDKRIEVLEKSIQDLQATNEFLKKVIQDKSNNNDNLQGFKDLEG
ncbi:MAG: XRE family transcriptional regulator [Bacteroidetes bacterium]|nr:MAG: XRE family transcriptional regulator [Bacteroidota bacterium]